jgi:hypothetical protein
MGERKMSAMKIRAKALKELENRFGRITAEKLLEAARAKTHPLHGDFEWDDKKAAYKYRLDQARDIIASVRIFNETLKVSTVGYVRDPEAASGDQGYVSVSKLRTETEAAEEALRSEVLRVEAILERAREIAVALGLVRELEIALEATLLLKTRLRKGQGQPEERIGAG